MKNICVYSSSSTMIPDHYYKSAEKVGELIGKKNYTLVYGAGIIGLMGETSKATKANGGKVIGVIPEALNVKGIVDDTYTDELIITKDMRERKSIMEKKAQAFIALPGGFGTLEELLEIITLKQLGYHNKPIVVLNKDNFYESLLSQFEKGFNQKFAKECTRELYHVTDNEAEAFNYIENYKPEENEKKWF